MEIITQVVKDDWRFETPFIQILLKGCKEPSIKETEINITIDSAKELSDKLKKTVEVYNSKYLQSHEVRKKNAIRGME